MSFHLPPPDTGALAARLLAWYDRHRRHLPWRMPPGVRSDPYLVWVSEVMLQQVRVETVARYYGPFVERWPTVGALAAAPLEEVLRAWSGLGRYARAHNLHASARLVVERHGGRVPEDEAALLALPGVGPYTAAAILAIGFGRGGSAVPVDGNIERVVARLFALGWDTGSPASRRRAELRRLAASLAPQARPGDHAQALMDLGATICIPNGRPRCGACPVADACAARAAGVAETLALGPKRAPKPKRFAAAFWVSRPRDGAVLMRRRPARGLLGGTLEPPSTEWRPGRAWRMAEAVSSGAAPVGAAWRRLRGRVRHALSDFEVEFAVMAAADPRRLPGAGEDGAVWVPREALEGEALSTMSRKLVRHALAAEGRGGQRGAAAAVPPGRSRSAAPPTSARNASSRLAPETPQTSPRSSNAARQPNSASAHSTLPATGTAPDGTAAAAPLSGRAMGMA
ncbi:A/G-specific adenine glycosylase [Craurococcus roseus]|uniref:Adenine DNA glycosylase n=1 Tax=Craurococcus roseus TaxID=77585 RepID=A0ABN1F6R1_9PROT